VNQLAGALGVRFNPQSAKEMQSSLEDIAHVQAQAAGAGDLITSMVIRAMNEAQYVCTGASGVDANVPVDADRKADPLGTEKGRDLPPAAIAHYGLGLAEYTHFTSPIRRYADVVVHKQLLSAVAYLRWLATYDAAEMHSTTYTISHQEGVWLSPSALPKWAPQRETVHKNITSQVREIIHAYRKLITGFRRHNSLSLKQFLCSLSGAEVTVPISWAHRTVFTLMIFSMNYWEMSR
jgi:hypothetical protein